MFWAGHVEEVFVFALYSGHLGDFTMENLRLEGKSSHSLLRAVRFVIVAMLAAVFFFFFNALQVSSPGATGISGLHSRRTRGDRHSSRVEAKNPALLSSRDGIMHYSLG